MIYINHVVVTIRKNLAMITFQELQINIQEFVYNILANIIKRRE
jgi:hypothetical protein